MTAISRRLLATGAGAALLFAIAGIVDGCAGSVDCNSTATCPTSGDDVAVGGDSDGATIDASDTDGTLDGGNGKNMGDGADVAIDTTDATVEADSPADANDAPVEARLVDRGVDMGTGDADAGKDAAFEAEAGVPTCVSNVLAPVAAVASSVTPVTPTNVAANAIDHIFTTRWESVNGVDPQWIYLDFGAIVFIDRVQIAWETACGQNYDLQTSNDAVAWSTMASITGNTIGGPAPVDWTTAVNHQGFTGVGRYMRINGTTRCTIYGYSIWEMQVYGDTNPGCHP